VPEPAPRPAPKPVDTFEEVLGLRPQAQSSGGTLLVDLLDGDTAGSEPQSAAPGAGEAGLLSHLPPGVPSPRSLDQPRAIIDLSVPVPGEAPAAAPAAGPATAAAVQERQGPRQTTPQGAATPSAPSAQRAVPKAIPTDAKAFGSEDLFGNGSQERTIKDEAVAAYSTVYGLLPEQAKQLLPACMEPILEDNAATEDLASAQSGVEAQLPHDRLHALEHRGSLQEQHAQVAVDRACSGKWVPTYMRQQMAQNGHTTIPRAPNAHEHDSGAAPPTLGQAFAEMGDELGESAQTMLTFMLAFLSSLATQCQACTHQTVSTVHDQVVTYGENLCSGEGQQDEFGDQVMMGRPLNEAAAGLGPVRSQVRHDLQVSFATLADIAKRKLVTPNAPAEFEQVIRARELTRQVAVPEQGLEDWLFSTEVRKEAVPQDTLQHICASLGPLACTETWHVELREERAEVEISNAQANGPVTVVLRVYISGKPEGGGCDVDSRLFARPREHSAMLPLGLVEQLTQVHRAYSESLRSVAHALAQETGPLGGNSANESEGTAVAKDSGLPSVAHATTPPAASKDVEVQPSPVEKRLYSWDAEGGACEKRMAPERAKQGPGLLARSGSGPVDSSLLLQVADGI